MSLTRRQVSAAGLGLPLALTVTGTAQAAPRRPRPRTLHIAGDSTAAQKYADAAPETGWGTALPFLLRHDLVVANHAVNGRSSKSFVDEGRLDAVLDAIRPDDLLLIQFAHNDEKATDPSRYRTLAQCSTLQGGGVGHPARSGPKGRGGMAKIALSDDGVVGPTAGRAGSQACGGRVRPTLTGRQWPVKQEPEVVPRSGTDRNLLPSGRRGRQTEPWTTYREHLRLYVAGARARGARPVLATPVERRRFGPAGDAVPSHGAYPAAMRALADEERVALLDVQALSLALWQELGVEETKKYFNWTATEQDNTHFNPPGAIAVARLVARELLRTRVLAPRDVRRLDEAIPESWITWPDAAA
ncbi:rhamnogalacturonan acetylesterase [Streptomyces sp. GDS52]|uniref:rhamnogalacturonan acetylesterase n=1 Tax=Streptomyces sp. GDS52 TaxID=3406419 RepID=UPI003FD0EBAA